ncbi:dTDP-4-dehydrorhamnose 3,5-epimerase family protein [Aquitalea sp. USM4]|uniref:dTDP-4-dehydrorhamnose 3,5-epimerase family protein n=1 Tax=Aquitalea sp. USM4 TaxID=1590041 RepID=UPI00103E0BDA|nr:dTDP-4-dehydrorhamnose 3,5-epimerase family protein [Aquitalea sp. USM4]QBJ78423.1 dTDP-4-dehydrorhamnose 3,5-epimerase [Aquitalea sp. USM4]
MKIIEELLPGCLLMEPQIFTDHRGEFVKTFHDDTMHSLGVDFNLHEEFYSVSHKNVLRGMHFQSEPHAHAKIVYCLTGAVMDVLLDLRSGQYFGKTRSATLSGSNKRILYIPPGIAHGFLSLQDHSLMMYKTDVHHVPAADCGIRWDSFGFDWGISQPLLSERDMAHPTLSQFASAGF